MDKRSLSLKIVETFYSNTLVKNVIKIFDRIKKFDKFILLREQLFDEAFVNGEEIFPILKKNKEIFNERINPLYSEIMDFIFEMEGNLSEDELYLMYKNLLSLRMKSGNLEVLNQQFKQNKAIMTGGYDAILNTIVLYSKDDQEKFYAINNINIEKNNVFSGTCTHELLHSSSSIVTDNIIRSGFYLAKKNSGIGKLLNEGYTELLNEEIFGYETNNGLYGICKKIALFIEKIVGKDKMRKLYFTADLNGLIQILAQYSDIATAKKIIYEIDTVSFSPKKIINILVNIFNIYCNKIYLELRKNKISFVDYLKLSISFRNEIIEFSKDIKKEYERVNYEEFVFDLEERLNEGKHYH